MTEAGKRLLQAAHEALAFAKGEADPSTYIVHDGAPAAVDVKAIRTSMKMTQEVFGERFGFGKARIRDWEQRRTRPTASDRVLLTTIQLEPGAVLRALAAAGGDSAAVGAVANKEAPERISRSRRDPEAGSRAKKERTVA